MSGYANRDYGEWLPHLEHDTRTNQVDIQLQQLKSDSSFQASKFSLEFAIVSYCPESDDCQNLNITKGKITSLDDEHTPGIFSVGNKFYIVTYFSRFLTFQFQINRLKH